MEVCKETAPFKTISIASRLACFLQEATMVNYLQDIKTLHQDLASLGQAIALHHKAWTRYRMMVASLMVGVQATDSIPKLALANKTCKRSKNLDSLDRKEGRSTRAIWHLIDKLITLKEI